LCNLIADGINVHRAPADSTITVPVLVNALNSIKPSEHGGTGHGLLLINLFGSDDWAAQVFERVTDAVQVVKPSAPEGAIDTNSADTIAVTILRVHNSPNRIICVSTHTLGDDTTTASPAETVIATASTEPAKTEGAHEDNETEDDERTLNNWNSVLGIPADIAVVENCVFI
jgi:hypothetical protein